MGDRDCETCACSVFIAANSTIRCRRHDRAAKIVTESNDNKISALLTHSYIRGGKCFLILTPCGGEDSCAEGTYASSRGADHLHLACNHYIPISTVRISRMNEEMTDGRKVTCD